MQFDSEIQFKHPSEQLLLLLHNPPEQLVSLMHNPPDKLNPVSQAVHTPVEHVEQFKGQQYPPVKTYEDEQFKQESIDVQFVHHVEQAVHTPDDK